ncbi:MAG: DUF255 domain-containing protein [Planctomycetaceae bacterium]
MPAFFSCLSALFLSVFICLTVGCSFEDRAAYSDDETAPVGSAAPLEGASTVASTTNSERPKHPANRLARESSPYLLLHAHNPVDWYPWGPEAFEKAKKENKPIFLSVGYSSCFWCHVMERKVFENPEIAAYMNEHFVNVKVDREERPDIDDVYMTSLQVYFQAVGSNQGGGWPMSMFLTPTGLPIAGGTYFGPEELPGRPGFPGVLKTIRQIWAEHPEEIEKSGELIASEVRRIMKPGLSLKDVPMTRAIVRQSVDAIMEAYDETHGGFEYSGDQAGGPKFPAPSRLSLLQSVIGQPQTAQVEKALDHTMQRMSDGGLYDHLGGGFHRYSVDREWLVPHFEKMLYDNAQLADLYTAAFRRTSRQSDRLVAEGVFDFVLREMTGPEGGFHSALDAETDGVEGAYYVWSPEEVNQVLGEKEARLFKSAYGLTLPEFFEHGYVLHLPVPLAQVAQELQMPEAELKQSLSESRVKLLKTRNQRAPLLKDDKVLASWNGLMIRALAHGSRTLNRPDYLAAAEKGAMFVAREMRDEQGHLHRTWRGGKSKLNAYLDDYAFLTEGMLALYEVTQDPKWLNASRRLMDLQIELFWDPQDKGFFFTSHQHEALLARTKTAYDAVLPSGNSVSVRNLVRLAVITEDPRYRDYARDTLQLFLPKMEQSPGSMSYMTLGLQDYIDAFGESLPVASVIGGLVAEGTTIGGGATPGTTLTATTPTETATTPAVATEEQPLVVLVEHPIDKDGKHKATVRVYLASDQLVAGKPTAVAVVVDILKPWHMNANNPKAKGVVGSVLSVKGELMTELVNPKYPEGHEFSVEGFDEKVAVYEGQVVLYGELTPPADAAGKTEALTISLRYQACNDKTCTFPQTMKMAVSVPIAATGETPRPINQQLFGKEDGTAEK